VSNSWFWSRKTFLLYVGLILSKQVIGKEWYEHFWNIHVFEIRLLISENLPEEKILYADELKFSANQFDVLYGDHHLVYHIHSHLANDCRVHGRIIQIFQRISVWVFWILSKVTILTNAVIYEYFNFLDFYLFHADKKIYKREVTYNRVFTLFHKIKFIIFFYLDQLGEIDPTHHSFYILIETFWFVNDMYFSSDIKYNLDL
jgi:hypothetical protein